MWLEIRRLFFDRQDEGGLAHNVDRQNVAAIVRSPGFGHRDVATRMWPSERCHQGMAARMWPPVCGCQDAAARTWMQVQGLVTQISRGK